MDSRKDDPFFSVVVPTKNRPKYLKQAIQSVLMQSFQDYELIISDNFNDQPTVDVINQFSDRSQLVSYRTDKELNMVDHWEFATQKAMGRYVILLADRKMLIQHSLKKLHQIISKHPGINVFSFGVKVYDDQNNKMAWNPPMRRSHIYSTKGLITNFLSTNYYTAQSCDHYIPKTLNGCYKNSFAREVRSITNHYFNNAEVTTPDYSSFFINMALNDEVMHIGLPCIMTQGESTSNGRQFGLGQVSSYLESLGAFDIYRFVPIKAPFIYNLLVADFYSIKALFGSNLKNISPDWNSYFKTNYWELLIKDQQGIDKEGFCYFYKEWKAGFHHLREKADIKYLDENVIKKDFADHGKIGKMEVVKNLKEHVGDFLLLRFPSSKLVKRIFGMTYRSGLEAAGFKEFNHRTD